jgi:exopolysaccharide biosynthesis polyprenyl glycosylphosphotransferase
MRMNVLNISNIAVAIFTIIQAYLPGYWYYQPRQWSNFLVSSLEIFIFWRVISRLLTVKEVSLDVVENRWLILGCNDNSLKFCQVLLAKNSSAQFVVLSEKANVTLPSSKNYQQKSKSHQTTTSIRALAIDIDTYRNEKMNIAGSFQDLEKWTSQSWSGVVLTTKEELSDAQMRQLMQLRLQGIPVYRLPEAYQALWFKLPSSLLGDAWFTFNNGLNLLSSKFHLKVKYIADVIISGLLLIVLSPLMLLVVLAIKLDSSGSVFYTQIRTGLNGNLFKLYKFRSMYQDAEKQGVQWTQKSDPRITRVGYWLRKLRIDELPQLWNILQGEMSLVGPRPERPEFDAQLKKDIPYYEMRYLVKPGITGWAQVLYAYGASVEDAYEKLAYDLYYIQNYSLWLDVVIFFKTIGVVILGKGQ